MTSQISFNLQFQKVNISRTRQDIKKLKASRWTNDFFHDTAPLRVWYYMFSNSLIIHEASTEKIITVENVWKSEEEIT